jgi:hypothetical protein
VQKVPGLTRAKKWTIRLAPAQVVSSVSRIPYTCCGTYTVFDAVYSTSGALLGRGAASFTFA